LSLQFFYHQFHAVLNLKKINFFLILLGDAIVASLAQSMKKLAEAIHNCKSRPIIKVNVMLSDDKVRNLEFMKKTVVPFIIFLKIWTNSTHLQKFLHGIKLN
jgi:hypothetical protein